MHEKPQAEFHRTIEQWKQADLLALAAEELVLTVAQLARDPTHDLVRKAVELRMQANLLFEELVAAACPPDPGGSPPARARR